MKKKIRKKKFKYIALLQNHSYIEINLFFKQKSYSYEIETLAHWHRRITPPSIHYTRLICQHKPISLRQNFLFCASSSS